jgi:hypothetical protein
MAALDWPVLEPPGAPETMVALHLCNEIVGEVRLALEPIVNHW